MKLYLIFNYSDQIVYTSDAIQFIRWVLSFETPLFVGSSYSDFVLKDFTLSIPFSEHVSYLCVKEEKTNQLLKISRNWLFKDLLTNKQFSTEILSGSLIMLDSENRELVWSNLPLKCIVVIGSFYVKTTIFFGRSTPHHLEISSKLALALFSDLKSSENLNSVFSQLRKLCPFEILLVLPIKCIC